MLFVDLGIVVWTRLGNTQLWIWLQHQAANKKRSGMKREWHSDPKESNSVSITLTIMAMENHWKSLKIHHFQSFPLFGESLPCNCLLNLFGNFMTLVEIYIYIIILNSITSRSYSINLGELQQPQSSLPRTGSLIWRNSPKSGFKFGVEFKVNCPDKWAL